MLAMDSESSETPDSTPQMLLEAHLFWCILMLYSKVNGTQTLISDNTQKATSAAMLSYIF